MRVVLVDGLDGSAVGGVDEGDFVAGHGAVVGVDAGDDGVGDVHDDAEGDDGAHVDHRSQHPRAVLVDLQAFDVVVGHADAGGGERGEGDGADLGFQGTAKGVAADHEGAGVGEKD